VSWTKPTPLEKEILSVSCPTCGSDPGQWCMTRSMVLSNVVAEALHSTRLRALEVDKRKKEPKP